MNPPPQTAPGLKPRTSTKHKLLVAAGVFFGVFGLTAASATLWYQHNFHASPFKPVALTATEEQTLESKLAVLNGQAQGELSVAATDPAKTIVLTEKEVNGWLARQEGLADKVKFHMNNDTVGATVLVPVDEEVPVIGGQTLRFKVIFNSKLDAASKHLNFSLADVSVGGISLPNAWLGDIKGLNLLANNGPGTADAEVLQRIAAGIKDFKIRNGELRMVLND